jgi:hypothetical protein
LGIEHEKSFKTPKILSLPSSKELQSSEHCFPMASGR